MTENNIETIVLSPSARPASTLQILRWKEEWIPMVILRLIWVVVKIVVPFGYPKY